MIPVFVINLGRRTDRWAAISENLDQIGLTAERIPAVDARDLPDEKQPRKINPGSAANIMGHAHAMRHLLESDAPAALILEDDAELSSDTTTLLRSLDWWPEDAKVVRLEASRARRRFIRLPASHTFNGRAVCRMEGRIPGLAAYLFNRDGAQIALSALIEPELTIDQILFDLKKSRAAKRLRPYQIVPSMAHQRDHGQSDIEHWRKRRPQRRPLAQTLRSLPYKVHLGIAEVVGRANAHRAKRINAEQALLRDLPTMRAADYEETSVLVTSSSDFILRRVFYTVPSRLIGHRLGVRLYDDRLELFLSGTHHLTVPRGRAGATGPHAHVVNYRHVIHSLKKKPMALKNLVYRDALFPREAYRRCFERALERLTEREACRLTVTLLALAHEENCEAELAVEIERALKAGRLPDPDRLKARFAPDPAEMPRIVIARPHLAGYGSLLAVGGAS